MISTRHQQLYKVIKYNKPTSIVEVGTFNGINALHLITWACKFSPNETIKYYGFDVFEDGSKELDEAEFNAKERVALCQVEYTLRSFRDREGLNFEFELIKGNTRETLQLDGPWKNADFAFIDGGHSIDTILSDYANLQNCKVIALDDYYTPDKEGKCPDTNKVGCNQLLKGMPNFVVLPVVNNVINGGHVSIALMPMSASPYPVQFEVKTKNCVDNSEILNNIDHATRIDRKWLPICKMHNKKCVIVAAGPSYLENIDEIRDLSNNPDYAVFCVKSNYKSMLAHNINIHGVVLLDPRNHVQHFLEPIRDDIYYYIATMCHPSTSELFNEAKNAYFWHALVGAGEQEYIGKLITEEKRNVATNLIVGGSTATMRAIFVAYMLGFRSFIMYGVDSCFWEPQNMAHVDNMGQPYFWNVSVGGNRYLTSLQLYSQAQEFGKLLEGLATTNTFDIEVRGRGIIKDIYDASTKLTLSFEDFVNAGN